MKPILKYLLVLKAIILTGIIQAQDSVEMATGLRSEGKIYVVVGVIVLVFIGIVLYLIKLDRQISKVEKESKET